MKRATLPGQPDFEPVSGQVLRAIDHVTQAKEWVQRYAAAAGVDLSSVRLSRHADSVHFQLESRRKVFRRRDRGGQFVSWALCYGWDGVHGARSAIDAAALVVREREKRVRA